MTKNNFSIIVAICALIAGALLYAAGELKAVSRSSGETRTFEVKSGEGFRHIVDRLKDEDLIRSSVAFKLLSVTFGSATKLKPGLYKLDPSMTSYEILNELIVGSHREISVTVPEGATIYEIDTILSENGIIKKGSLAARDLMKREGRLFPDTYKFFTDSDVNEVVEKFLTNFASKTKDSIAGDRGESDLVLASLLEKEVPDYEERKLVAGILKKRIKLGIPLQVDATICYLKVVQDPNHDKDCYPLSPLDFKIESPYNTYLYGGLPPGPIGNPGISAIKAALSPTASPYLFYLSDPKTKKTIFAKTLEEQIENKARYLQK